MTTTTERLAIDVERAIDLLPQGEYVHTFMMGGPMLVGADWTRDEITTALRGASQIDVSGENAQRMGHGLAIPHPRVPNRWLFIRTRVRTDSPTTPEPR